MTLQRSIYAVNGGVLQIDMSWTSHEFWQLIEKKNWSAIYSNIEPQLFKRKGWSNQVCEQLIYISLARGMPADLLATLSEGKTIVKNANVYVFLSTRYKWVDQYALLEFLQHSDIEIDALLRQTSEKQAYFRCSQAQEMFYKFRRTKMTWRVLWVRDHNRRLRLPNSLIREIAEYW